MAPEEATTDEQIDVADITPSAEVEPLGKETQTDTAMTPNLQDQFLDQVHDRLMMAHALVTFSIVSIDSNGALLKLTDKDLAHARYAAGVLVYGDESGQWSYAGDGIDGTESDSPACVLVRCSSFPARS